MDIAVIGSRKYAYLEEVREYVQHLSPGDRIISGHAIGPDQTAEDEGRKCGLEVLSLPAQWELYGRGAGYRRNVDIVSLSDKVVAFWDCFSKGTLHSITLAIKVNKPVELFVSSVDSIDPRSEVWKRLIGDGSLVRLMNPYKH